MEFSAPLLQSIERLQYQATPGEFAVQAGLPLATVERDLQQLAIAVGGHLQVATTGEIVYKYPSDFRNILYQKSLWLQVKKYTDLIWKIVFYLIRMSFGLALVASLSIVVLTIIIFTIATMFSDNDGGGIDFGDWGSGGGNSSSWGGTWWYFDWGGSSRSIDAVEPTEKKQKPQLNFLGAVFSFLFGEANPNANLEELRWRSIGQVIRKNQGAITAEQVAPYLEEALAQSEDHILPVLVRFNGIPEVSEIGDIVYRFPDTQTVAQQRKFKHLPPYLQEKSRRFSGASKEQVGLICALGALNFAGIFFIGALLKGAASFGLIAFVGSVYGLLATYAIGFVTIPLVRLLWLKWSNHKIATRNEKRRQRLTWLHSKDATRKLDFAQQFQVQRTLSEADMVYNTEEDLLDQEIRSFQALPPKE
jgi:hypothetical protein